MPAYKPIDQRFLEKVKVMDGCHEWQGAKVGGGYGHLSAERGDATRTHVLAHRYAWERVNGPIPKGLMPIHSCDNPGCCNIEHLRLGTHQDNMDDMRRRGRAIGSHSRQRKLSPEVWVEIRARVERGEPLQRLEREFQVDRKRIRIVCVDELRINPRKLGRPRAS